MFTHTHDGTTVPKVVEIECRHTGSWPSTETFTLNVTTEPSTVPPGGVFNQVTRFAPDPIQTDAQRSLAKWKRRQRNKLSRPAWRR